MTSYAILLVGYISLHCLKCFFLHSLNHFTLLISPGFFLLGLGSTNLFILLDFEDSSLFLFLSTSDLSVVITLFMPSKDLATRMVVSKVVGIFTIRPKFIGSPLGNLSTLYRFVGVK